MSFTIGSLFDGSGGFPLAAALCGGTPKWASEIEPYPIAVTKKNFPDMKHLGDISKINGADIEPVDLITFGSPCQDLSVAGKRAGMKHEANGDEETTRSGLFMEAVRIIKEMRRATNGEYPKFCLWENVPGAFSSNKGEDFRIVLEELIKIVEPTAVMPPVPEKGWAYADSYVGDGWSIAYRVLDAQYWGVPQRRRRIYLVLDLSGECARKVLFEREGLRGYFAEGRSPWQGAASDVEKGSGAENCTTGINGNISGTLNVRQDAVTFEPGIVKREGGHIYEGVAGTLRANAGDNQLAVAYSKESIQGVIDVELEVAVRKYEVDRDKLISLLRSHKGSFTNAQIAEALHQPITLVEHWFRRDNCFAIPDPEVWFRLKRLLGIETTEFDACITEFEFKGGNYDMRNRIYVGDVAPTLTVGCGNHLHLVSEPVYCLQGNGIDRAETAGCNGKGWREDASYTLNTIDRPAVVFQTYQKVTGPLMANSHPGSYTGQDAYNDMLVAGAEPETVVLDRAFFNQGQNAKYDPQFYTDGTVPTLVARGPAAVAVRYIVRRLTPIECARLQGFADAWGDIEEKDSFTDEEYRFWLEVRNTHAAINGKQVKEYTEAQMLAWYNKLHADSSEYKMWGNGIALPTALYCMQGIAEVLRV